MADDDLKPVPYTTNEPTPEPTSDSHSSALSRRQALTRLGLAAGTAYAAPTLLSLTEAKAGPPWGRPSRPTEPGEPTKKT